MTVELKPKVFGPIFVFFNGTTSNFFKTHCFECHGIDEQKGKIRLDNLPLSLEDQVNIELWYIRRGSNLVHVLARIMGMFQIHVSMRRQQCTSIRQRLHPHPL